MVIQTVARETTVYGSSPGFSYSQWVMLGRGELGKQKEIIQGPWG